MNLSYDKNRTDPIFVCRAERHLANMSDSVCKYSIKLPVPDARSPRTRRRRRWAGAPGRASPPRGARGSCPCARSAIPSSPSRDRRTRPESEIEKKLLLLLLLLLLFLLLLLLLLLLLITQSFPDLTLWTRYIFIRPIINEFDISILKTYSQLYKRSTGGYF
jgi:hypothetical protein